MIRFLVAYWFLFIACLVICIQRPKLGPPLIRLLGLLYSLIAFAAFLFGLWLWSYPPFWRGIAAALLMLLVGGGCLLATQLLRHTYLASLIWIIVGVMTFLASNLVDLKITPSSLIALPPIMLASFSLYLNKKKFRA